MIKSINLDSLWDHQQKNHTCKKDAACDGCRKNICESCSIHSSPNGKWQSNCKSCQNKKDLKQTR